MDDAARALGDRTPASSFSNFRRRLCFGFDPSDAGTHAPGAVGGQLQSGHLGSSEGLDGGVLQL
jgi:hypothetical protein